MGAAAHLADRPAGRRLRHRGVGAFGRSGGADSLVGLLINTVPVRANTTATTTVADLGQLQRFHNDTVEHDHVALGDIHRLTGHDQLFDTLLVYENYPIDPSAFMNVADLAVTDFTSREYNHYPLSFVASPGEQMALRVEFDTDVFTRAGIATLVERFQHVLAVMAADPGQRLSGVDVLMRPSMPGLMCGVTVRC